MAKVLLASEGFDSSVFSGSSCAFGVFDGVHVGHQYLIGEASRSASSSNGASIALTFDIDPDEMFHADRLKKLMSNEARLQVLSLLPVDYVVVLPFTHEFASLQPREFLDATFHNHAPAHLHVGSDFRFGRKASGTVEHLCEWARTSGAIIHAHDLQCLNGEPVTSTRIRSRLGEGDLEEAGQLLTRPYFIDGVVLPGRGEGSEMGFRTANLQMSAMLQVLQEGVYAAWVIVDGQRYKAAVSVGVSPMFEDCATATCEVHILDFDKEIYGETIRVEFHKRLRPMMKFDSVEELIETVMGNIAWVRTHMH